MGCRYGSLTFHVLGSDAWRAGILVGKVRVFCSMHIASAAHLSPAFRFWAASFICAAWMVVILSLAFQPFEDQDVRPFLEDHISEEALQKVLPKVEFTYAGSLVSYREPYRLAHFLLRKGAHLFIYAGLAFLVVYQQLLSGSNPVRAFSRALLMVILVASADEYIQYLNDGRSGLVEDVVLDAWGSVFVLVWLAWRGRKSGRAGLNGYRAIAEHRRG